MFYLPARTLLRICCLARHVVHHDIPAPRSGEGPADAAVSLNYALWASTGHGFKMTSVSLGQQDPVHVIIAYDEQPNVPPRYENHLVAESICWDAPWSGNVLVLGLSPRMSLSSPRMRRADPSHSTSFASGLVQSYMSGARNVRVQGFRSLPTLTLCNPPSCVDCPDQPSPACRLVDVKFGQVCHV